MDRLLDYSTNHPFLAGGLLLMILVVLAYEIRQRGAAAFSIAPNLLIPYNPQTVSDVVKKGGFPPFLLPHVNFDALFERSMQEQAARQAQQKAPEPAN